MLLLNLLLLSVASTTLRAALIPIRQIDSLVNSSSNCPMAPGFTFYVPTTVYAPPETITIAVENVTSVSASLSSAASIDTAQVSAESEFAPVSAAPVTTPYTFVHSIVAPLVEATKATNSSSGVFYVSIGQNTTDWSYTPTQSNVVVGTTTVTVLPVPTSNLPSSVITISSTTTFTRTTTRSASVFPVSTPIGLNGTAPFPWTNSTQSSTVFGGASGSGRPKTKYNTTTITRYTTVDTITVNVTARPTTFTIGNATQTTISKSTCTNSDHRLSVTSDTLENISKRQVCTLVYATISGQLAHWCNNWNGYTVTHHSTYTSTLTPDGYATQTSTSVTSSTTMSEATSPTDTAALSTSVVSVSPIVEGTGPTGLSTTSASLTGESSATSTDVSLTILSTGSSSVSTSPPAVTACGQVGLFKITFDDLPVYSPSNNDTASYPPIFNPYDHFFWGNGWAYGPPPTEPYPPQGGDHLAEFVPSVADNVTNNPNAGTVPDSAFGAGPRAYNNNYWFNAESAYVGCDNGATDPTITCDFVATAYQWDSVNREEKVVATAHFPQPPCPNFQNCALNQIFFDSRFTQLTSLSFYANVGGELKIFWVDTIELSWWNNTCAAGLARISSP